MSESGASATPEVGAEAPESSPATGRTNSRERILDTALHLMAERGTDNTSMRALAKACGINVAALYHYFDSKDALLAAVITERRYDVMLAQLPALDPSAPPGDRLVALFTELWVGARNEEDVWRLLLVEGFRANPTALQVGSELMTVLRSSLSAWISQVFPELDGATDASDLILATFFGLFIETRFEPAPDDDREDSSPDRVEQRARQLAERLFPS